MDFMGSFMKNYGWAVQSNRARSRQWAADDALKLLFVVDRGVTDTAAIEQIAQVDWEADEYLVCFTRLFDPHRSNGRSKLPLFGPAKLASRVRAADPVGKSRHSQTPIDHIAILLQGVHPF
jgi:hypothetical protein